MAETQHIPSTPIYENQSGNKYAYNPYSNLENGQNARKVNITMCNYFCPHCTLTFEDETEYEHHNVELHGQKKSLTCHICTATFRRQDHLKRHMHSLHTHQKYSICPVCKKDFTRQDILMQHIRKKHSNTAEIFQCRDCVFKCNSHSELEKHELSHQVPSERHVCPHCGSSFKRRDHMLRHVKSQHLNQCVVCPVCDQKYKRKDHVVRHVREKHKMGYLNGKLITSSDVFPEYRVQ